MALSGQITVATAGTEVKGTSQLGRIFAVKALAANTGKMYVGESSAAVTSSTGFELSAGEQIIFAVPNLNQIWVDASVSGEKVCWFLIEG